MTELITISFTTPIIRNHRVSSAGPPATVLWHIKKNPRFFAALRMTFLDAGILFPWRKQKPQRGFDARGPGRFAVIAGLSFHVLKILLEFPAFLNKTIE